MQCTRRTRSDVCSVMHVQVVQGFVDHPLGKQLKICFRITFLYGWCGCGCLAAVIVLCNCQTFSAAICSARYAQLVFCKYIMQRFVTAAGHTPAVFLLRFGCMIVHCEKYNVCFLTDVKQLTCKQTICRNIQHIPKIVHSAHVYNLIFENLLFW